ncbi:MAG: glycosyl transferase [Helicobacteraceae bacterium CG2_30_36_10]|nr:MAG: glycosyl transferase [Helicobacteraceae bacterium CG2_30_36_10]
MLYVFLFISSFLLTYLIKVYAIKKSLVAKVTERSSHSVATPHGGGIAIALTWFAGISYLFYIDDIDSSLYLALMVGVLISVVSYFDDLFELSAKVRLLTQTLVALVGLYFLGGLKEIDLFVFSIENQLFTNLFAFLMVVWFINLYNFLDGIDGYAGSEALFLGVAGFLLFGGSHFLVLVAAVLGFLVWNWHKAKIFMGDVGSTLLGYNVAIFTIYYANSETHGMWIWIVLFGLFWFDATLTLFRRYKNGESLSQAHRKHAYQRLTQSGWAHNKVVLFSIVANCVLFGLVYFLSNVFVAFMAALVFLYGVMLYADAKKKF